MSTNIREAILDLREKDRQSGCAAHIAYRTEQPTIGYAYRESCLCQYIRSIEPGAAWRWVPCEVNFWEDEVVSDSWAVELREVTKVC